LTLPIRRTFRGEQDQVAAARDFVKRVAGRCPMLDEAVLLTSELCTNTLLHTASGQGGSFEVTVHCEHDSVRVEVHDDGSKNVPALRVFDEFSEAGRGLALVDLIATRWGQNGDELGRSVFFELRWGPPQTTTSHANAPTGSPVAEAGETSMTSLRAGVCDVLWVRPGLVINDLRRLAATVPQRARP
jgi:anti-sigma regulatory factor (Ser/Thr protein kinase)